MQHVDDYVVLRHRFACSAFKRLNLGTHAKWVFFDHWNEDDNPVRDPHQVSAPRYLPELQQPNVEAALAALKAELAARHEAPTPSLRHRLVQYQTAAARRPYAGQLPNSHDLRRLRRDVLLCLATADGDSMGAVSYTHLTLPTIYSV